MAAEHKPLGTNPVIMGEVLMVCEVCWKGGECVQEMEHDGEAST